MVMRTVFVNETTVTLTLKEGHLAVFRDVKTLKPQERFELEIMASNTTYREFVAVTEPRGGEVRIPSDDCIDTALITIKEDGKGGLESKMTPRHPPRNPEAAPAGIWDYIVRVARNNFPWGRKQ